MSLISFFFSVFGRMSRMAYWGGHLVLFIYFSFIGFVVFNWLQSSPDMLQSQGFIYTFLPFIAIAGIGVLASHNMTVRRLHDRHHSGLWAFPLYLPLCLPLLLLTPFMPLQDITDFIDKLLTGNIGMLLEPNMILLIALLGCGLLVFVIYVFAFTIELFLLKGMREANRYGPDPLEPNLTPILRTEPPLSGVALEQGNLTDIFGPPVDGVERKPLQNPTYAAEPKLTFGEGFRKQYH